MSVLEYRDVTLAYEGGAPVLNSVSLKVEAGQVVGLLGCNGAGKTTLLRIAMGMLVPQSGKVSVFGVDPRQDLVGVRRRIGYVSEVQELPPFMSVRDIFTLYRSLYPSWDDDLAKSLGSRFKLPVGARIGKLSKGQARQVALLCAISHRPDLLILDEPAGGLDPAARREFLETSINYLAESGTTILFSSHHMTDVERMASRLVMIHENQLWLDSAVDEVKEGYCLALLPGSAADSASQLLSLNGCLSARQRDGAWRAVFEMDPEKCTALLQRERNDASIRCARVGLEELFIEMVGGQS
jgi:ABC-2 type transport system ATP-binding protein